MEWNPKLTDDDTTAAVKEHDFKKCHQSGFCKRNRAYADDAAAQSSTWSSPYNVVADSVTFADGQLHATVLKTINANGDTERFPLTLSLHKSGTARVTVDEEKRRNKDITLRHDSKARKERYNEAENWVVVGGIDLDKTAKLSHQDKSQANVNYGPDGKFEAVVRFSPLEVDFRRDGESHVKFNDRGLFNMEHWRPKIENPEPKEGEESKDDKKSDDAESTWWEETFAGNTDSKPRGPESVGLDISFPGYEHVYGIPEHTGPMSLRQTRGGGDGSHTEPYRMYNSDVFEYELNSPMTLYGSIPFMQAHRKDSTVGVFWLNVAETWVDIVKSKSGSNPLSLGKGGKETSTHTHWFSEAGILDVFVFLGPTPADLNKAYGELTGYNAMPQEFSIGYHQCRWNYLSDDDVKDVDRKFDKFKIPYDVIWLDLEYTDDRKYFTWEPNMFADPVSMGEQLAQHGRNLVVLIDPHIKKSDNWAISKDLVSKDLAVHDKDDKLWEGWCWPGSSNWVDCFNPKAIEWWKTLFQYNYFKGSLENTFIWNDMNEPSVFNGPETTMPKDNLHHGDWEHRDIHNVNGLTFHNATFQAMVSRKKGEMRRPFILTRSFYAGSQRLGPMWTGDNQANWDHLAASLPMVLNQGVAGYPFAGADVGGFFGNPDKDLLTRWYQVGTFYPFFRAHAHIDSRRREPYLLGDRVDIVTTAIRLRYQLLPAWYTAFYEANRDGSPIVRPMFWTHPSEEGGFAIDDQLFVGSTGLLAKPVVEQGKETADIWIPDDEVYYDYFTYEVKKTQRGKHLTVAAPIDTIPLLMRGGHIFPRRDVPRRSAAMMRFDDYTLVVTVSPATGSATGELYADDGDSFDHEQGQYIHRRFDLATSDEGRVTLTSKDAEGRSAKSVKPGAWLKAMQEVSVDRIIVVGAPAAWDKDEVQLTTGSGKTWAVKVQYHAGEGGRAAYAVLGRVGAAVGEDWTIAA